MTIGMDNVKLVVLSSARQNNCDVPQGSALRPTLFLIYVNKLPIFLSYTQYADYTSAVVVVENIACLLTRSPVANMSQCWERNGLTVNSNKTNFLKFKLTTYIGRGKHLRMYLSMGNLSRRVT